MSELPMGWESVTVGAVCSVAPSDPPLAPDAPFISMASVEVGLRYPVSTELRGDRGGIRARSGDLLFARITPCLENEKVAVVPPDLAAVGGSTEFIVVRPPNGVASSILYYWSLHPLVRRHARQHMAGTTGRMRLSSSDLAEAPFWLPPTREQERIVTAIEEAFSKLDAGDNGLRAVRQLLKRMRQAVLAAAVTGRLVPQDPSDTPAEELLAKLGGRSSPSLGSQLPAGWAWCELGMVTVLQEYGLSIKAHEVPLEGDLPMLRMGNLQGGVVSASPLKYVRPDAEGVGQHLLSDGDVLFNRTNSAELVGKAAVYRNVPSPSTFASYLIRFRCAADVLPSWCSTVINSRIGRDYIDSVAVQQVGQANVNGSKLKRFPIPLPPAAEQVRIMAELERQFSFIEACERAVETGLNRSAALRRAVLKAAFDGRLVPQDPTDEPASALLERIRGDAERCPPSRRRPRPARSSGNPAGVSRE